MGNNEYLGVALHSPHTHLPRKDCKSPHYLFGLCEAGSFMFSSFPWYIWEEEGVAFKLCYGHAKVGNLIPTVKYYCMQWHKMG